MSKSVQKNIKMSPDLIAFIENEAKKNGLTQSEIIRLGIKSIKKETLAKIKEARELIAA